MQMDKQTGGIVLAFAGFVFLVGAVKGTWRNAWAGLTGGAVTSASGATAVAPANSGGGSLGNGASNLPGSAPAPFTGALA